jgi:hypothetical protein
MRRGLKTRRIPRGPLSGPAAVVALVFIIVGLSLGGCGSSGSDEGSAAPGFSGVTLEGRQVSLSGYRGKPLVLAFMASW